VQAFLQLP